MQKKIKNRIFMILLCGIFAILGIIIIFYNLQNNITFFLTPSQINEFKTDKIFRLGGFIKAGSIKKIDIKTVQFKLTDKKAEIQVYYQGVLPALFRDEQGIVASGSMQENIFIANELLVKHDENYRPPNID